MQNLFEFDFKFSSIQSVKLLLFRGIFAWECRGKRNHLLALQEKDLNVNEEILQLISSGEAVICILTTLYCILSSNKNHKTMV